MKYLTYTCFLAIYMLFVTQALYAQNYTEPAISSNGKQLVFCSDEIKNNALFTSSIDGSNKQLLVNLSKYESTPNWSPNGKWIVFYAMSKDAEGDVYITDKKGKIIKNLTQGKFHGVGSTKWIDNDRILFSYGGFPVSNIYVMNRDGDIVEQLTDTTRLNYYPDLYGDELVYCTFSRQRKGIYYKERGGRTLELSPSGEAPVFSPDGLKIAYQNRVDGTGQLFVMNKDGSGKRQLTQGEELSELPEWSPDGRYIYFQRKTNGQFGIWRLTLADGSMVQISFGNEKQ